MKRNNVQVFKDGRSWLSAETRKMFCPYYKEFDKTNRNKLIAGSWGHCKELYPEPAIELWWNDT